MKFSDRVVVGDVILFTKEDECRVLNTPEGEYVVEDVRESGGWTVQARKLNSDGGYCLDNSIVNFHQCPGYVDSLSLVRVVRRMQRIFI